MCEYIKEFGVLDNKLQDQIIDYVKKHTGKFSPSKLYSIDMGKKFMDESKRKSYFKAIREKDLFDLINIYVEKINTLDDRFNYILVKNDITFIKYVKGGFFKPHEDYLSLTTNMFEEYTGIMCTDAECEGGETIFHLNKYFSYVSKCSTTPKHCVIFRKDIGHEGAMISKGYKEILTFNLWAIPKENSRIIVVSFESDVVDLETKFSDSLDDTDCLSKKLRNCYIIPYNNATAINNLIKSYLSFNSFDTQIISYKSRHVTFKEFEVIYKILMRSYITCYELEHHHKVIDYFGIDVKNILIDMSITTDVSKISCTSDHKINDIFISETYEKTEYLLDAVKKIKLPYISFNVILAEGKCDFAGGFGKPKYFNMETVYAAFSEYNNILTEGNLICFRGDISLEKYEPDYLEHTKISLYKKKTKYTKLPVIDNLRDITEPHKVIVMDDDDDDYFDEIINCIYDDHDSSVYGEIYETDELKYDEGEEDGFNTEFPGFSRYLWGTSPDKNFTCLSPIIHKKYKKCIKQKKIMNKIVFQFRFMNNPVVYGLELCSPSTNISDIISKLTYNVSCNYNNRKLGDGSNIIYIADGPKDVGCVKWYGIDENNKTFLSRKHHANVRNYLKKIDFFNKLRENINDVNFIFPQKKYTFKRFFCNEVVYGNLNLIEVTGLVRLDIEDQV